MLVCRRPGRAHFCRMEPPEIPCAHVRISAEWSLPKTLVRTRLFLTLSYVFIVGLQTLFPFPYNCFGIALQLFENC